jgi:hypothetical protein
MVRGYIRCEELSSRLTVFVVEYPPLMHALRTPSRTKHYLQALWRLSVARWSELREPNRAIVCGTRCREPATPYSWLPLPLAMGRVKSSQGCGDVYVHLFALLRI